MSGRLEVVTGPMFSGKTERLIERLKVAQSLGHTVKAYKPKIDGRYATDAIVSHKGRRFEASPVDVTEIEGCHDTIGLDEGQFFGDPVVEVVTRLVQKGVRVIISGLDLNCWGEPFGPMPTLLSLADDVMKLRATCKCGADASRSQRIVSSAEAILVGGSESYEPRCLSCFDPHGAGK
jgi:thymidine kinase